MRTKFIYLWTCVDIYLLLIGYFPIEQSDFLLVLYCHPTRMYIVIVKENISNVEETALSWRQVKGRGTFQ